MGAARRDSESASEPYSRYEQALPASTTTRPPCRGAVAARQRAGATAGADQRIKLQWTDASARPDRTHTRTNTHGRRIKTPPAACPRIVCSLRRDDQPCRRPHPHGRPTLAVAATPTKRVASRRSKMPSAGSHQAPRLQPTAPAWVFHERHSAAYFLPAPRPAPVPSAHSPLLPSPLQPSPFPSPSQLHAQALTPHPAISCVSSPGPSRRVVQAGSCPR